MANTIDYRTTGVVTAPVSLKGVADLIGAGSYDLGKVCTSGKVNPYSPYKPIRFNAIFKDWDETSMKAQNWGYWIPPASTLEAIAAWICDGSLPWSANAEETDTVTLVECGVWKYLQPRGNNASPKEPYRLGDFRGYDHNTDRKHFFDGMIENGAEFHFPLDDTFEIDSIMASTRIAVGKSVGSDNITGIYSPTDFGSLSGKYLGLIAARVGTNDNVICRLITSGGQLAQDTSTINFDVTTLNSVFGTQANEWNCILVASPTSYSTPVDTGATGLIVLPFKKFKAKLKQRGIGAPEFNISVTAVFINNDTKQFQVNVSFQNKSDYAIKNVTVVVNYAGGADSNISFGAYTEISPNTTSIKESTFNYNRRYDYITVVSYSFAYGSGTEQTYEGTSGKKVTITTPRQDVE